jgi:hypothetical protein
MLGTKQGSPFSSIDVFVAILQRALYARVGIFVGHFVNAQTELRNGLTIVELEKWSQLETLASDGAGLTLIRPCRDVTAAILSYEVEGDENGLNDVSVRSFEIQLQVSKLPDKLEAFPIYRSHCKPLSRS